MTARTSDRMSKIAAGYAQLTPERLLELTETYDLRRQTAKDIRAMAASLLRQDEHRGLRGLVAKVIGR